MEGREGVGKDGKGKEGKGSGRGREDRERKGGFDLDICPGVPSYATAGRSSWDD